MVKFILIIMTSMSLFSNSLVKELESLNTNQLVVLHNTYEAGKAFDLQLTMTAIAWHESHFGEVPINISDPSCGVFHNLLSSVANRHNIRLNNYNKNILCMKLINNYEFAFSESLNELLFWKSVHRKRSAKWSKMVMSYNAGYHYKNGKAYLREIQAKVKALKVFLKKDL